jgi:hypothetical protein
MNPLKIKPDMMKTVIITISMILLFAVVARAETACQSINSTGNVINAAPLARTMNKWLALRGINYKTTSKEMTNTVKNFCKSNPYGTADDITNHLKNIVDVLAAAGN